MNNWAEFRHFRYLLAIVEHKGFRAAAEHLHTSEPNLSVQARQFQEAFDIQLFTRGKDGHIQITETGVAFKPIAQGLLDARDEAIAALVAVERGQVRTLSLGCAPFVDPELLRAACEIHKEIVPGCPVRPTHGDTVQLLEELVLGEIDAAIMMLPVNDQRLCVQRIRRDRLVACLRADHALAAKAALRPADLQGNLAVLHHPQRHPSAHARLLELLARAGVQIEEFSRASHPAEMQALVKAGCGLALICEGTPLDTELTTRPVAGVDWAVDTALVYSKQHHQKTIPLLARHLKRRLAILPVTHRLPEEATSLPKAANPGAKRPPRSEDGKQGKHPVWSHRMKIVV
jgi:DNA-binding transcriptional LysR family regulator